jgi:hypothetical protein
MSIYTPPNCFTLDKSTTRPQIRLGIQGYSGTGKTFGALSFPNPIVLNLDRGLGCHAGRTDVIEVPFYKKEFSGNSLGELKDRLMEWINKEAKKLSPEQTLVFDGCTSLQNAYHAWFKANQHLFLTKAGKVDDFAEWREKKNYYAEIMETFKMLSCDVIFIAHETAQKDKDGGYTGKIRPLLTGQFGDEIVNHFSDWLRQLSNEKPTDFSLIKEESLKKWEMTIKEFKEFCDNISNNSIYYWQTSSDNIFDGKVSSLVNCPMFVPANYSTFQKYSRK